MRLARHLAFAALALLCAVTALAQSGNVKPDCVEVRAVPALGAYGTNHIVVVENRCDVAVHCEVATDVDPSPRYPLDVPPGHEGSVATRAESPSAGFRPLYTCVVR